MKNKEKYTMVSKIVNEGPVGAAVWGGQPYLRAKQYELQAQQETDPIKKKQLLNMARRWKLSAAGGATGGAIAPFGLGTIATGPIGAAAGYIGGMASERND